MVDVLDLFSRSTVLDFAVFVCNVKAIGPIILNFGVDLLVDEVTSVLKFELTTNVLFYF